MQSLILGDIDLEEKRSDSHCIITFPLIDLQYPYDALLNAGDATCVLIQAINMGAFLCFYPLTLLIPLLRHVH